MVADNRNFPRRLYRKDCKGREPETMKIAGVE